MNFIAFQQFTPLEQRAPARCIWCGELAPTNCAHIISRKLTASARNAPKLHFNVCQSCNSKCGKLEEWVLRFTPLSWLRLMSYISSNVNGSTRHVPSYFFSDVIKDWIVFHLDSRTRSYAISTQLVLSPKLDAVLITQASLDQHKRIFGIITAAVCKGAYQVDIRGSLPDDFSPRILLDNSKVILITKTEDGIQDLAKRIESLDIKASTAQWRQTQNTGREQHHFKWSDINWARFCAKTALEALCLFEGGEECLQPAFSFVRDFVLHGDLKPGRELVFNEKGPLCSRDVPRPVYIDLTIGQSAPKQITALIPQCNPDMHFVYIYEIHGWVVASVMFAGFPPSVMILGGHNEHVADLYQLIYDHRDATYDFLRLAYDRNKPIIPLPMPGDKFMDLAETYGLKV